MSIVVGLGFSSDRELLLHYTHAGVMSEEILLLRKTPGQHSIVHNERPTMDELALILFFIAGSWCAHINILLQEVGVVESTNWESTNRMDTVVSDHFQKWSDNNFPVFFPFIQIHQQLGS